LLAVRVLYFELYIYMNLIWSVRIMVALITGGAASGKSGFAEKLAVAVNKGKMAYLATMQVTDEECTARVARHRILRAGKGFETLECPLALPQSSILGRFDTALLECMSNFVANVIFTAGKAPDEAGAYILDEVNRLRGAALNVIIVTNEVFSDSGSYDDDTRSYIRTLGSVNRRIAATADVVVESVCGIAVVQKDHTNLRIKSL
jgi:adenosylcobinamide kinase / adenosylcobinamide-phosphate guanylyltransferase